MKERIQAEKNFQNRRAEADLREKIKYSYRISNSIQEAYLRDLRAVARDKTVMEYGCAKGERILTILPFVKTLVGIDVSDLSLQFAHAQFAGNHKVGFAVMNGERMGIKEGAFDVVYGSGILHHLDLRKALPEIRRVLKSDGKAFFIEPLGHNLFINLFRWMTPSLRTKDEHPLLKEDLDAMGENFCSVNTRFYYLLSLLGILFVKAPFFLRVMRFLEKVDRFLFEKIPMLKYQAWMVLIVLESPRK